ncbi:hypothetical protein HOA59_00265 [archaeon]|jgi:hypothetical protein|nr:hypothetical protein [archaeon]MBT6823855.1 hypothetical protein [archaeon]MBT7107385.1 hypothetical protein [archaeon]MBT7297220.1 hypothetical protein [archaeon]
MTELVACLTTGKGSWTEVAKLIAGENWEKVYLITNDFGKEKFDAPENVEMIVVDPNKSVDKLRDDIILGLKEKINGTEVAVNLISGSGNEHMALFGALIKLGVGLRLVSVSEKGIEEV